LSVAHHRGGSSGFRSGKSTTVLAQRSGVTEMKTVQASEKFS
jgi:hypothetical protein